MTMIIIRDERAPFLKWLRRLIAIALLIVAPIGIGVVVDSAAMQWIGFIIAMIGVIGTASNQSRSSTKTVHSIDEARRVLSELEART